MSHLGWQNKSSHLRQRGELARGTAYIGHLHVLLPALMQLTVWKIGAVGREPKSMSITSSNLWRLGKYQQPKSAGGSGLHRRGVAPRSRAAEGGQPLAQRGRPQNGAGASLLGDDELAFGQTEQPACLIPAFLHSMDGSCMTHSLL